MSLEPFKKFINKKNNAAIKEKIHQEKKAAKKKRAADIEKHFSEKRSKKFQQDFPQKFDKKERPGSKKSEQQFGSPVPLNKFLSHCGVASRREAAEIVKGGKVKVNGNVVIEPGFRVTENDTITYNNKKVLLEQELVYILLNKPKDFITTTSDPKERKTVMQLIKNATTERVYPVGRLDRNTSGVLLITNDGELTQRLTHPSFNVMKLYEVKLDKPLTRNHFSQILDGVRLEDGEIKPDALAYTDQREKNIIGIELHSGRNRIVRRIFEHLGYEVKSLDRVIYAGLTKKNVERGHWRHLSEAEVRNLKHLSKSKKTVR
ncbi:MAG: rRNA pseudouridine synthase [Chitinophagaceae bacterium]|nr:rRNA pseudouridine synthase [Chitinophagaceae bacterium]